MTRSEIAVRKATRARLLADMRTAAQHVAFAVETFGTGETARAYVAGILEGTSSATVRACLITVWS